MLNDFKDKLLGTYHNQQQAYNNPAVWAHIYILFEETPEGNIFSKSWYAINSPDEPYRQSVLELIETEEGIITRPDQCESCDILFRYENGFWVGEHSKCILPQKNQYVSTSVRFDGTNYFSRDAGYDLDTDRFIWGKEPHEGHFHFIKYKYERYRAQHSRMATDQ